MPKARIILTPGCLRASSMTINLFTHLWLTCPLDRTESRALEQKLLLAIGVITVGSSRASESTNSRPKVRRTNPRDPPAVQCMTSHMCSGMLWFEFVADNRYIGCSKPSCHCQHYMQLHPEGFTPRPCHRNLWINRAPPMPLPFETLSHQKASRPQDHHTF